MEQRFICTSNFYLLIIVSVYEIRDFDFKFVEPSPFLAVTSSVTPEHLFGGSWLALPNNPALGAPQIFSA